MDAFNDPLVEDVVVMSAAQIGKTEILLNVCGYFMDQDPSPILVLQPNVSPMGEAWSKDRLAPMLRDTPCLRGKVRDPRSRDSGNTVLHKVFPGGHITVAGANSPAGLRSRPIRVVLCDEVDAYDTSAGTEGDPVSLAFKRTANFWNRKRGMFSTPGIAGSSRIELAFNQSDKRKLSVPCPFCGEWQYLFWGKDGVPGGVKWPEGKPGEARYECQFCSARWNDGQRWKAVSKGHWVATAPFTGVVGFFINALCSPWIELKDPVKEWIKAQSSPELLKVFVNTVLGETWEERHDVRIDAHELMGRAEAFEDEVPEQVAVITAGVDVQADRLVMEIVGWGRDEESWSLKTHVIPGDTAKTECWKELDEQLSASFAHPCGQLIRIRATCIDSGYKDSMVLRFTRDRFNRRIYATKGRAGDLPIWPRRPSRKNLTPFFIVGVDAAKDAIYDRLRINDSGPGFCHFPAGRELDFYEELTAEKKYTVYHHGYAKRQWRKEQGVRNEALDCRVEAYAALQALYASGMKLNSEAARMVELVALANVQQRRAEEKAPPLPPPQRRQGPRVIGRFL